MIFDLAIANLSEQNDAMRHALDVIREHEVLRESLAAKGVPLDPGSGLHSMAAIAQVVASRYNITLADMRGPRRDRHIVWPRQEAIWLIRQVTSSEGSARFSTTQVGRYFGGRDHTTIIHASRAHEARALARKEAA